MIDEQVGEISIDDAWSTYLAVVAERIESYMIVADRGRSFNVGDGVTMSLILPNYWGPMSGGVRFERC